MLFIGWFRDLAGDIVRLPSALKTVNKSPERGGVTMANVIAAFVVILIGVGCYLMWSEQIFWIVGFTIAGAILALFNTGEGMGTFIRFTVIIATCYAASFPIEFIVTLFTSMEMTMKLNFVKGTSAMILLITASAMGVEEWMKDNLF